MIDKASAIQFIKNEYARLDQICKVDTSNIEIIISSRMTRQLGCFTYKRSFLKDELQIKISERILSDDELFLDVIRHEYAHAVVHIRHPHRKHVHDDIWKSVCLEVGCIPKATRKISGSDEQVKERPDKYLVRCNNCYAESKYRSEGKVVKILLKKKRGRVVCKQCGHDSFTIISIN